MNFFVLEFTIIPLWKYDKSCVHECIRNCPINHGGNRHFFVRVEKISTCTVVVLHTCLVDNLIIIYYIYLSLTFSMTFVSRCFVLYPLHLLSSSVEPLICLRVITIVCPLYVHRMSTETVDIRWRCGGDSVDILCSHIEGTEESERTYLGGLSDSKRISDVEYTYHHRMIFLYRHTFFMYCSYYYKVN